MFPAADLASLIQTLRMCVMQVMGLLGTRARRAPSNWSPENQLIPEPLVVLIGAWMHKQRAKIEALMHRIAAGTHISRPYAPRRSAEKTRAPRPPPPAGALRLPKGRGWITRLALETFNYSGGFIQFLNEPIVKAMVQASPQLVRLWMPLLNAHGQTRPDWMTLPPRPPRRPRRERMKRPSAQNLVIAGPDPATAPIEAVSKASHQPAESGPAATELEPARSPTRQAYLNDLWVQLSRRRPIGE